MAKAKVTHTYIGSVINTKLNVTLYRAYLGSDGNIYFMGGGSQQKQRMSFNEEGISEWCKGLGHEYRKAARA